MSVLSLLSCLWMFHTTTASCSVQAAGIGVSSLTTRCICIPARFGTVLWSACDQVMEIGINHKVASTVPEYLGKIAMLGGRVRLGAVTNSERAINMRFKHASRHARVPHIHPGYARV